LKVYNFPEERAKKVMTLTEGDTVKVVDQQGSWVKLQLPGKRFGWLQITESTSALLGKKTRKAQGFSAPPTQRVEAPALITEPAPEITEAVAPAEQSPRRETQMQTGLGLSESSTDLNLGISFTLGALGESFAYSGRFLYRSLPSLYLEGTFQHVPGDVAASLLLHSNLLYSFSLAPRWEGWLTGGVGIISTSPTKTVGAKSVSNMEVHYGVGVRRYLKHRTYLRADVRQFSVLVDGGTKNYVEFAFGIIIGVR
jgi:hypothetical protein